jgi:hypothetical protein
MNPFMLLMSSDQAQAAQNAQGLPDSQHTARGMLPATTGGARDVERSAMALKVKVNCYTIRRSGNVASNAKVGLPSTAQLTCCSEHWRHHTLRPRLMLQHVRQFEALLKWRSLTQQDGDTVTWRFHTSRLPMRHKRLRFYNISICNAIISSTGHP